MRILNFLQLILLPLQAILAAFAGYMLFLTVSAWRASLRTLLPAGPSLTRFAILIPAHNEETLLPACLQSLNALDYPQVLYKVHVVADNCTDRTAQVARAGGATAHERQDTARRGKGYALQWLVERLLAAGEHFDAAVILDADSKLSHNFLRVMDARFQEGERVIQAYYTVEDPGRAWSVSLRYIALAVLHYLRPLGRTRLGGSAGLKGNGMVFAADILAGHTWSASLTEDIEFHMQLLLDGERVAFAPDATVEAEMPQTLTGAQTQNERWEQGRLEMARRYVPLLLRRAVTSFRASPQTAFRFLDAAMEHLIPPTSVLVAVTGATAFLSWLLPARRRSPAWLNRLLGSFALASQALYLFAGLRLAGAPRTVYQALLHVPRYILWKLLLYVRLLLGRETEQWIRTARNKE